MTPGSSMTIAAEKAHESPAIPATAELSLYGSAAGAAGRSHVYFSEPDSV